MLVSLIISPNSSFLLRCFSTGWNLPSASFASDSLTSPMGSVKDLAMSREITAAIMARIIPMIITI